MSFPSEHIDKFLTEPQDSLLQWCDAWIAMPLVFDIEDAMGLTAEPTDPKMRAILVTDLAGGTYRTRDSLPDVLQLLLEAAGK